MFDFETTVSGIEYKVRQLAEQVGHLRKDNLALRERIQELQEALEKKEKTINELIEENRLVKLGNRLNEGSESAELKLKISQNIRAIDKCLAILRREGFDGATAGTLGEAEPVQQPAE